ncbi:unnamed protein product [Hydatigera taeniaeformis]|uniref:Uncharacterized protein n=1 Tax=Hydatigena taeniaeformis TaxID=6205 RepID=A0A0R3XC88_HYDTA|nr:unnamed protein product [Hydatigera taeniaeformis]
MTSKRVLVLKINHPTNLNERPVTVAKEPFPPASVNIAQHIDNQKPRLREGPRTIRLNSLIHADIQHSAMPDEAVAQEWRLHTAVVLQLQENVPQHHLDIHSSSR